MHFQPLFILLFLLLNALSANAAALHDAAKKGDKAGIAAALDGGADINEIAGLVTPLYVAIINTHLEAAKLLIEHGAERERAYKIRIALARCRPKRMPFLCETTCRDWSRRQCAKTPERRPAIHLAKKFGYSEVADYLITHGYINPVPPPVLAKLNSADPSRGRKLFVGECSGCHDATAKMRNGKGPHLWNIVGRPKASIPTLKYSRPLLEAGGNWDYRGAESLHFRPDACRPGH